MSSLGFADLHREQSSFLNKYQVLFTEVYHTSDFTLEKYMNPCYQNLLDWNYDKNNIGLRQHMLQLYKLVPQTWLRQAHDLIHLSSKIFLLGGFSYPDNRSGQQIGTGSSCSRFSGAKPRTTCSPCSMIKSNS